MTKQFFKWLINSEILKDELKNNILTNYPVNYKVFASDELAKFLSGLRTIGTLFWWAGCCFISSTFLLRVSAGSRKNGIVDIT